MLMGISHISMNTQAHTHHVWISFANKQTATNGVNTKIAMQEDLEFTRIREAYNSDGIHWIQNAWILME